MRATPDAAAFRTIPPMTWGGFMVVAFRMLQCAVVLANLGADDLDRLGKHRTPKRLVRRFDALGYGVMLRPRTATA